MEVLTFDNKRISPELIVFCVFETKEQRWGRQMHEGKIKDFLGRLYPAYLVESNNENGSF